METIITDGGRAASSHPNEKLDCTIRAYAVALNIPYDVAHAAMKSAGRKDRHKFHCGKEYAKSIGRSCKRSGSAGRFIRDNPVGRFIVEVSGHVYAVIDGVPHDTVKVREHRRVTGARRVA